MLKSKHLPKRSILIASSPGSDTDLSCTAYPPNRINARGVNRKLEWDETTNGACELRVYRVSSTDEPPLSALPKSLPRGSENFRHGFGYRNNQLPMIPNLFRAGSNMRLRRVRVTSLLGLLGCSIFPAVQAAPQWDQIEDPLQLIGHYLQTSELCALVGVSRQIRKLIQDNCTLQYKLSDRGVQIRVGQQVFWVDPAQNRDWSVVDDIHEIHPRSLRAGLIDHLPLMAWQIDLRAPSHVEPRYYQSISRMLGNILPNLTGGLLPGCKRTDQRMMDAARTYIAMAVILERLSSHISYLSYCITRDFACGRISAGSEHSLPQIDYPHIDPFSDVSDEFDYSYTRAINAEQARSARTGLPYYLYPKDGKNFPFGVPLKMTQKYPPNHIRRTTNDLPTAGLVALADGIQHRTLALELLKTTMRAASSELSSDVLPPLVFIRLVHRSAEMIASLQFMVSTEEHLKSLLEFFNDSAAIKAQLPMFNSPENWIEFRDRELGPLLEDPALGYPLISWIREVDRMVLDVKQLPNL